MEKLKLGKEALSKKFQQLEEGVVYTREDMNQKGISDDDISDALREGDIFELAINRFRLLL